MSDDRKNRMKGRFNTAGDSTGEDENNSVAQDSTQENNNDTEAQSGASEDDNDEPRVRDAVGRTFYVGEETLGEIDSLYKKLDVRYDEVHGGDLPKNKVFYPALFELAAENPDLLAEKLGLADSDGG